MSEMLYLQTERNIKITSPVVTLGDVAQLSCSDGAVLARNQTQGQQRRADGKAGIRRVGVRARLDCLLHELCVCRVSHKKRSFHTDS